MFIVFSSINNYFKNEYVTIFEQPIIEYLTEVRFLYSDKELTTPDNGNENILQKFLQNKTYSINNNNLMHGKNEMLINLKAEQDEHYVIHMQVIPNRNKIHFQREQKLFKKANNMDIFLVYNIFSAKLTFLSDLDFFKFNQATFIPIDCYLDNLQIKMYRQITKLNYDSLLKTCKIAPINITVNGLATELENKIIIIHKL